MKEYQNSSRNRHWRSSDENLEYYPNLLIFLLLFKFFQLKYCRPASNAPIPLHLFLIFLLEFPLQIYNNGKYDNLL